MNSGIIVHAQRTFIQSSDELKTKYKRLMTEFHPDRHASTSDPEEEKLQKASMATDVTRAYGVIIDPLSRALHLLELNGAGISESDNVRYFGCVLSCASYYLISHVSMMHLFE